MLHKQGFYPWIALIVIAISLVGIYGWKSVDKEEVIQVKNITIAAPKQISVGALYVAAQQDLFAKRGIEVRIESCMLGREALQSVLNGKADLAILADTPFMFAVMDGKEIAALSTVFGSRRMMAIMARRDRGINSVKDLLGKKIGTFYGTNAQFFVDSLLVAHSIPKESVTIVDIPPQKLTDALKSGEVDAVTVWDPQLSNLANLLGDQVTTIYDEGIFVYRFILVGKRDYVDQHLLEMQHILSVFSEATDYIHKQPDEAQTIIEQALGVMPQLLNKTFNPNDFYLTLDQTLLLSLSAETRWAVKRGLVAPAPIPNYLDYIRQQPLEAVLPNAIKFIH